MVRSLDDLIGIWQRSPTRDKTAIEDAEKLRDYLIRKTHDYDKRYTRWLDEQEKDRQSVEEEASRRSVDRTEQDTHLD